MKLKPVAKLLAFSGAAVCFGAMPVLADGEYCRHVGGGILTNFLPQTNPPIDCAASPLNLCTDGTATGDLSGAVGVAVRSQNNNVLHNHHHWVTASGDTITFDDADLTLLADVNGQYLATIYTG